MFKTRYFLIALLLAVFTAGAQTVPVGLPGIDDRLRDLQLQGRLSSSYSLMNRPAFIAIDSVVLKIDSSSAAGHHFRQNKIDISLMPATVWTQYNTHHPWGWNDAGMVQAAGFQTMITAGFGGRIGPLSFTLMPEAVYAANPDFETSGYYGGGPSRGSISKIYPGQSSIRVNAGPLSLGVSTENLWWGPGVYNALVMSNNAPGFGHFTLNTTRPIRGWLGTVEFQLVSGRLDWDANRRTENFDLRYFNQVAGPTGFFTYKPVPNDWRYFNGLTVTYSPKWTPGLYLGFNRVFQVYNHDIEIGGTNFIDDYLPVFTGVFKSSNVVNGVNSDDSLRRDQLLSFFARYTFLPEQTELYFEYALNDHSANARDFTMEPSHSAAYLAGIRKLFPIGANGKYLQATAELTQMQRSPNQSVRYTDVYYIHGQIYQGYEQDNQIMGAGINGANNLQTIELAKVDGWDKLGVRFDRLQHVSEYTPTQWVDIALGFNGQKAFGKRKEFLACANLTFINSSAYAFLPGDNRLNLHFLGSLTYRW